MRDGGSVLVFGGTGMLGHELVRTLSEARDVHFTARDLGLASRANLPGTVHRFDARGHDPAEVIAKLEPAAVVNAIGIVKQLPEASVPTLAIAVNSLFPHRLNEACVQLGTRLIHISTDCVFAGGLPIGERYLETDLPDAQDLYGRTKLLGEIQDGAGLTLRTSILGWELERTTGLLEWFAAQDGATVSGFTRALFSGLTTAELAHIILRVIDAFPELRGLFHVASEPITKYDLLRLLRDALGQWTEIQPRETPVVNRALDGSRFERSTGIVVPSWKQMAADYLEPHPSRRDSGLA
jgi:dTDP-4-dehydrorhamnose reductase